MLNKRSLGFIAYLVRRYPGRTALLVSLLILSGIAEGFGVVTLLPAIELSGNSQSDSRIGELLEGALAVVGLTPSLGLLLGIIVFAILLKGGFLWLAMRQVGYTVAHVATDLRLNLIRSLLKARWSYFTSQPVGHFANAISQEAHRASTAYGEACQVISGLIQVVTYTLVAFLVSWQVAVLAMVAGAVVLLVLGRLVDMSRRAGQRQTTLLKSLVGQLTDVLHGIKPIKAMGREDRIGPLLEQEANDLNYARSRQILAYETVRSFQEPLLVIMLAIGLYAAITWGNEEFSSLIVLAFLFNRLVGRINLMQSQYQGMAIGESAFWSLRETVERAESERDHRGGTVRPSSQRSGIRMESVTFSYGNENVLSEVSLTINPGEFVAISGPSGSGKTTIADLIVGLLRPDAGEVFIDDVPMKDVDITAWQQRIGYVPQEMFLLNETIFANVALGDDSFSEQDVIDALKSAGAWEFVSQLPGGLQSRVGERGAMLSGGQRQRVALARALVTKPALLVLDEVTTALDPVTEAAICDTLRELRRETTILAISHQSAMVRAADTVIQMEHGVVRELRDTPRLASG